MLYTISYQCAADTRLLSIFAIEWYGGVKKLYVLNHTL